MCGRFDFHGEPADIEQAFGNVGTVTLPPPSYNVAPTMQAATLVQQKASMAVVPLTFGVVRQGGGLWVNARAESLQQASQRAVQPCAVVVNGFYEWRPENKAKQPYYFHLANQEVFALAAVRRADSFLVVTCAPNALVQTIHGRMPVVLNRELLGRWLDGDLQVLEPYAAELMRCHPVSRAVNQASFDGPACIAPSS